MAIPLDTLFLQRDAWYGAGERHLELGLSELISRLDLTNAKEPLYFTIVPTGKVVQGAAPVIGMLSVVQR